MTPGGLLFGAFQHRIGGDRFFLADSTLFPQNALKMSVTNTFTRVKNLFADVTKQKVIFAHCPT